eukprot:Skav233188  [mRNA]  locus=scaffold24:269660:270145:- [translate_table: standard]
MIWLFLVAPTFAVRPSREPDEPEEKVKYYGNRNIEYGQRCGCSYSVPNLKLNDCCSPDLLCDPKDGTCKVAIGGKCKEKKVSISNRKCAREVYGPQKDLIQCGTESCCVSSIPLDELANPTAEVFELYKPINGKISSCCGGIIKVQEIDGKHYPFCAEHWD